jgi:hypothetical protein
MQYMMQKEEDFDGSKISVKPVDDSEISTVKDNAGNLLIMYQDDDLIDYVCTIDKTDVAKINNDFNSDLAGDFGTGNLTNGNTHWHIRLLLMMQYKVKQVTDLDKL